MVEALAPDAAEEPLAGGVLPRCAIRRPQLRDAARRRDAGEGRPVLAVVVADEVARAAGRTGVASRSCWATQASVGWRVTPTWTTRREPSAMTKKAYSGPEEQVGDRQEVAGPDVRRRGCAGTSPRAGRRGAAGGRRAGSAGSSTWPRGCRASGARRGCAPRPTAGWPRPSRGSARSSRARGAGGAPGPRPGISAASSRRNSCAMPAQQRVGLDDQQRLRARRGRGWPGAPAARGRPGCSAAA